MEKKIVIKEIDKLVSVVNKDRVITEYIVYVMHGSTKIEAHTELGNEAMRIRATELAVQHGVGGSNFDIPIERVSFEEMYNIKTK
jgi:hypothetical protein